MSGSIPESSSITGIHLQSDGRDIEPRGLRNLAGFPVHTINSLQTYQTL